MISIIHHNNKKKSLKVPTRKLISSNVFSGWTCWYTLIAKCIMMEWNAVTHYIEQLDLSQLDFEGQVPKKKWIGDLEPFFSDNSKGVGPIACWDHCCYVTSTDTERASGNMSSRQAFRSKEGFSVHPEQWICSNDSGIVSQHNFFEGNFTYLER